MERLQATVSQLKLGLPELKQQPSQDASQPTSCCSSSSASDSTITGLDWQPSSPESVVSSRSVATANDSSTEVVGIPAMLDMLCSSDPAQLRMAANTLKMLSMEQSQCMILSSCGGVHQLVQLLRSTGDCVVQVRLAY